MEVTTVALLGFLLLLVFLGVEVAVSLGVVSFLALYLATGDIQVTLSFMSSTAYEALRDYVFAVVPLFLLMGELIARSGVATDLFEAIDRRLKRLRGRIAYATVLGNVIFAFVTGTSVASATAFTRIAYPQMRRYRFSRSFSLGLISGSACIGMLIPPSMLMIVWAILTEQSIGHLFLAGIGPGLMLALTMVIYIFCISLLRPAVTGAGADREAVAGGAAVGAAVAEAPVPRPPRGRWDTLVSLAGFVGIIFGALGGIWTGIFTPTEGAGMGALIALLVAVLKGMRWRGIYESVLAVGRSATPLMVIVFTAQLYSRSLSLSGIASTIEGALVGSGLPDWGLLLFMIVIWMVLGMLIDSISIIILTVPIFAPVAVSLGYDPMAFAMIGILTIEAGLLTPPFGILAYAVKAVVDDDSVTMGTIFAGATPFWIMLLIIVGLVIAFPSIATYLPRAI